MKEKKEGVIRLEETSKAVMEEVLEYLYTGHVDLNEHNAFDLMAAADYFLISSLKDFSAIFILQTLSHSNCIVAYYSAINYRCEKLQKGARDYILANFEAVTKCDDFQNLSTEQVEEWISSDEIIVDGEERVFDVILRWFEGSEERNHQTFFDLLRHVRCIYVSRDYLFKVILPHPVVKENVDCSAFVLDAMKLAFDGTEACFFSQSPRNCLKTHENAIIVCTNKATKCYVPSQNKCYELAALLTMRRFYGHAISACHGKLYVIGGTFYDNIVERYEPSSNVWVPAKAPEIHVNRSSAVKLEGFLYVLGGKDSNGDELSAVQKYNPDTNLWQEVSPLSSPRSSVCAVADGSYLYAIGGISSTGEYLNTVERFDPRNNTWHGLPSILTGRGRAGGAAVKQKVFVFGGLMSPSTAGDPCEMYNPATNTWTGIPNDVSPRCHAKAVSLNRKIYVFGAFQNSPGKSLQVYDIDNNKWEHCANFESVYDSVMCKISCLRILRDVLATCEEL